VSARSVVPLASTSNGSRDGRLLVDALRLQVDGVHNIWSLQLAGGEPRPITHFGEGRIFDFDWAVDGRDLLLSRGDIQTDVVLLTGFR